MSRQVKVENSGAFITVFWRGELLADMNFFDGGNHDLVEMKRYRAAVDAAITMMEEKPAAEAGDREAAPSVKLLTRVELEDLVLLAEHCAKSGLALDDHGDELCSGAIDAARQAAALLEFTEWVEAYATDVNGQDVYGLVFRNLLARARVALGKAVPS